MEDIKLIKRKKPKKVDLSKVEGLIYEGKTYISEDDLNMFWNGVFEDATKQAVWNVERVMKEVLKENKEINKLNN